MNKRVLLMIMDSVGIGASPDAASFGDHGCNTLANTARAVGGLSLPHLQELGLGNIAPIDGVLPSAAPRGSFGRLRERSAGKDTTTGHWEMMGIILDQAFPTYPNGFPIELIQQFEKLIGRKTLGNVVASGTVIIQELGGEHIKTGYPIVYTSADSVFQIAAHEEIIPLKELYQMCHIAREMLTGDHAVGRVIARPFIGSEGNFVRTPHRHDYSLKPAFNVLNIIQEAGQQVIGIGKIADIFDNVAVNESFTTTGNQDGVDQIVRQMGRDFSGLLFANLVDFDQLYGHRRDPQGYAQALQELDGRMPEILNAMGEDDLLIISADHGCDPTIDYGTDHTREDVPLLIYGPRFQAGVDLGIRKSFADIGQTVAEHLGLDASALAGQSFLKQGL
ncbi:MAG TPA: phosphopentomutase [Syntrophomonadaceae bacterium]|nr:phosphopentomutase [Syntrophomonadaceae bacterium]